MVFHHLKAPSVIFPTGVETRRRQLARLAGVWKGPPVSRSFDGGVRTRLRGRAVYRNRDRPYMRPGSASRSTGVGKAFPRRPCRAGTAKSEGEDKDVSFH